ncbi:MAG: hypothetical protein LBV43_10355 [Prevotella sp.]|jgi:hypothetical protein|nr:hypothetical protein [Prevotella sp.]
MKNLFIFCLLLIILTGCENDDLKLNRYACTLNPNETYAVIDITKGDGGYKADTDNQDVAVCRIEDNKIIVLGIKAGDATITVVDKNNNSAEIKVNVSTTIPRVPAYIMGVEIKKGETIGIEFADEIDTERKTYISEVVDEDVAITTLFDKFLFIRAIDVGMTEIYVSEDYWIISAYSVTVIE